MNAEDNNLEFDVSENELDILSMLIGDDEEKWRNTRGQIELINQFIQKGERPMDILKNYFKMNLNHLPEDPLEQWSIILHLIMEGPHRKRLEDINTFQQACDLIKTKNNIIVLTGAGISVPCGVPDFRSRNGIYARLAVDFPDLDEPQSMFDIHYFCKNPRPFFKFAKEIYPGKFTPSSGHMFIKLLEDKGKLLRNYTQNIDTLEQVAGIKNIIQCHGSFATATCMRCEHRMSGSEIEEDVMKQQIPICPNCTNDSEKTFDTLVSKSLENDGQQNQKEEKDGGEAMAEEGVEEDCKLPLMKPDVVFFGEGLPRDFHATLAEDKDKVDLLIVIGSSLKVRPVAHVPGCLPSTVPQILINKEPLSNHEFDVELLGDCDVIVKELCRQLNWQFGDCDSSASGGEYTEKTIFEMRNTKLEEEDEEEGEALKKDISDDITETVKAEEEDEEEKLDFINVADLLTDDVTCIRVPPNRFVFRGADFVVNVDALGQVVDRVQSNSFSEMDSDDDDCDGDDDDNEEEEQKQQSEDDQCPNTKKRRVTASENGEHEQQNGEEAGVTPPPL